MSSFSDLPDGGTKGWLEEFAGSERRAFKKTEFGFI
jgi:hypothetical protein